MKSKSTSRIILVILFILLFVALAGAIYYLDNKKNSIPVESPW